MESLFSTSKRKLLLEIAWEVCNQVGGIYTVIRSKVPAMVEKWDDNYVLLGPYFPQKAAAEYEPITDPDETEIGQTVRKMRQMGYDVEYGYWLVTGRPRVVMFNVQSLAGRVDAVKAGLWERHQLPTLNVEELVNQTLLFGEMVRVFITLLAEDHARRVDLVAHFHEWMAASGLPGSSAVTTYAWPPRSLPTPPCWVGIWPKTRKGSTRSWTRLTGRKKLSIMVLKRRQPLNGWRPSSVM